MEEGDIIVCRRGQGQGYFKVVQNGFEVLLRPELFLILFSFIKIYTIFMLIYKG